MLLPIHLCLTSCLSNHFYVLQGWIEPSDLASSYLQTPDPRQQDPLTAEKLVVSWSFSNRDFQQDLTLSIDVRFWDGTQELWIGPIDKRFGYKELIFPKATPYNEKRILCYRIEAINAKKELIASYDHPLWVEWIEIGD